MARPNVGNVRKSFQIPGSEAREAIEFAALNDITIGALVFEWAESFVENGTDYEPDPPQVLQAWGAPEVFAAAERRAREEYGVGFREIIRHEIAELRKL